MVANIKIGEVVVQDYTTFVVFFDRRGNDSV